MHLTPGDTEKLLLAVAGMVARDRLERGVRLNHPEAVALLSTWVIERAREGARVAELMEAGRHVLTADQVMPDVAELLHDVQVEATFPDGRKLVTIHDPIAARCTDEGPGSAAGSPTGVARDQRRPRPRRARQAGHRQHRRPARPDRLAPAPAGRQRGLEFDREAAQGFRLDIPSGTSRRFEPGASRRSPIVALRGPAGRCPGLQITAGARCGDG